MFRREEPRSEIIAREVHGIASHSQGRAQGPFILWDISDLGLRLWMPEKLPTGEVLRLTIAKPFVVVLMADVRWCKPVSTGTGFAVGVRVLDNLARLEELHAALRARDRDEAASKGTLSDSL